MTRTTLSPEPLLALDRCNTTLAIKLGVSRRTVIRWRHGQQRITVAVAEQIADRIGRHPATLWADYHNVAVPECGTRRAYVAGCRCDDCATWNRDRAAAWRQRAAA